MTGPTVDIHLRFRANRMSTYIIGKWRTCMQLMQRCDIGVVSTVFSFNVKRLKSIQVAFPIFFYSDATSSTEISLAFRI